MGLVDTLQQLLLDERQKLTGLWVVGFVEEDWGREEGREGAVSWLSEWQTLG